MRSINECVSDLLPTVSALSAAIGPLIGLPAQQATLGGAKVKVAPCQTAGPTSFK